jgi:osmoprotectant transport system ATP-binding protein
VRGNVGLSPRLEKFSPAKREEEINHTLDRLAIDEAEARAYPSRLSNLQRFRAALARALAGGPTVVLLDEPFFGFDRESRDFMRREFLRIRSLYSTVTFVTATREVVEAVKLATHIALMREGKLLEMGSKKDFIDSPHTKYGSDLVKKHRFQIQLEAVNLREMMIQDPVFITTAQSNLPLSRAVFLMRKHRIGSLLVTDENRVLQGLIGLDETAENQERRIGDLIRHDISWLRTTDSFSDALRFFVEYEDEFLPVTDESNHLQGLITRKGVSKYLEKLI